MRNALKVLFVVLIALELLFLAVLYFGKVDVQLLSPKGLISTEQRNLAITAILLMLLVAAPVYIAVFVTAFRFREKGKNEKNIEEHIHSRKFELLWWVAPSIIIFILSFIVWNKTHALDPYKPLSSSVEPIKIQVVALRWKWLFIYPKENIAAVNFVQFPEKTPVNFELTSDAPMNSFWIPSLSGQIYAMTGMSTKLHVLANEVGDFPGTAAEINGEGFSGMKFLARSSSRKDFESWVAQIKSGPAALTGREYERLSKPSQYEKASYYSNVEERLYESIIKKYMLK